MLKKLVQSGVALALVVATAAATITPASAHRGGRTAGAVAGAIIGLGILGAYAASRDRDYYRGDYCYEGRRRCEVVGQRCHYNRWDEYVCRDDVRCWRPRHCD